MRNQVLAQWLNATTGHVGNDRIKRLLRIAQEAASLTTSRDLPHLDFVSWKARGNRRQMANARKLGRLVRKLNRRLSFYKSYPKVQPRIPGQWYLGWRLLANHDPAITVALNGDSFLFSEGDALRIVLDLAKQGELHRIKCCQNCQKWFSARVSHQSYCCYTCQQQYFRRSKEFRVKRREYMHLYRQRERERDTIAKGLANGK